MDVWSLKMKIIFEENSKIANWALKGCENILAIEGTYLLVPRINFCPLDQNKIVLLCESEYSERQNERRKQEWKKNREGRMKGRWMKEQIDWLMASSCARWRTGAKKQMKARHGLAALWATLCFSHPACPLFTWWKLSYILSSLSWLPCRKMPSQAHHCLASYLNRGDEAWTPSVSPGSTLLMMGKVTAIGKIRF